MNFTETISQSYFWAFVTVFGAGILTSLTPCVYPMIPITVSIFGAKESKSRAGAFVLATFYVLGIAAMYSSLGVLAAMGGWAAGSLLAARWFVILLSLFFIVMATSMFGLWEIRIPFVLQNKLSSVGGKGYLGAFAMGLVGGILIAPCTGPVLAGVLAYVATTRNVFMGASLLFIYALGIGVLFWIIATFAVSLPKSGKWMEAVKTIFGIALLVAALYYLENIWLPLARYTSGHIKFAAINGALILVGVILGGIHLSFHESAQKKVRKLLGILLVTAGLFGLINFMLTPSEKLPWLYDEAPALKQAASSKKPIFVDFWAQWCVPCKQMEATVLADPIIRRELKRFVMFKVDVTNETERDEKLRQKYQAGELPQLILLDSSGNQLARAGKIGSVAEMLAFLKKAP